MTGVEYTLPLISVPQLIQIQQDNQIQVELDFLAEVTEELGTLIGTDYH